MIFETYNEETTFNIAKELGSKAKAGDIFCLVGDLGVGKTVFAKGFATGLNIEEHITSPTFTIVQVYDAIIPLYHFDMYRIENTQELEFIGYQDYFWGKGVCLVEWANRVTDAIPDTAIWVSIEKDLTMGLDYRKILIDFPAEGEKYE
ncbi:MAG: tRNA (adenosine(37)-N6)-threonylcarbamoyltransferase complex ATPase subunit type 1 TsaE [Epulopiscium sp. Nuni2H_MBin001]|nr:MAG: tRNA (adenosine(37)-N6)-threonylcarbamoyltransferase complex ATPase subunit type 1 TsaE [Epulopiscium sp. Nuni2H_MBin001]